MIAGCAGVNNFPRVILPAWIGTFFHLPIRPARGYPQRQIKSIIFKKASDQ
jgi:hypothetical protein